MSLSFRRITYKMFLPFILTYLIVSQFCNNWFNLHPTQPCVGQPAHLFLLNPSASHMLFILSLFRSEARYQQVPQLRPSVLLLQMWVSYAKWAFSISLKLLQLIFYSVFHPVSVSQRPRLNLVRLIRSAPREQHNGRTPYMRDSYPFDFEHQLLFFVKLHVFFWQSSSQSQSPG